MGRDTVQLETAVNTISHEYLLEFTSEYGIPETLHPVLPGPEDMIVDFPEGWMSFSKRPGRNTPQCYTKPLDSLKNWDNRFFWVDERVFPIVVDWRTNAPKDGMPAAGTYSQEAVRVLDTHRTPIQKQSEMLLCLVGISRRYYLGDEVTNCCSLTAYMDLFNLIRAPNPTKVKVGSRLHVPHEVPLLTLTAPRVIEMDEPAATDSSSVPSTIERSSLDFAHEAGASDQGVAAPEIPSSEDVPATVASGVGQAKEAATMDPPSAPKSRKRSYDKADVNAPPKSLRRDYADPQPLGSSRGGKSLAAIQLGLASSVVPEDVPVGVSDPDPVSFADAPSRHPADVAQFEQEAKLLRKSVAQVARRDQRIQARELEIKNLEARLETEAGMKKAAKDKSAVLIKELEDLRARFSDLQVGNEHLSQQRCAKLDACLDALSIDFDEELYPHMLTTIAGCRWVIGHGLHLTMMKCAESLEMRQAFADVVSAGVAKGMSEGLKHGLEHGHAQLKVESIEAYDSEAEAKFFAALQSLKDLKYPLLDLLEGLKDAPMDLTIPVYPEVRDPRHPWAYKEEMKLSDAIAANITRAEKKKKCRIVCRTHGVGSAHHARSDGVPVSVPTVVPQGRALLLH
nr:hypothetical protein [Tanacetum cinerariifolium]